MSKKIWRGKRFDIPGAVIINAGDPLSDCTVVQDSACFPVREAKAFCRACEDGTDQDYTEHCWKEYLAAVERIKKEKAKK